MQIAPEVYFMIGGVIVWVSLIMIWGINYSFQSDEEQKKLTQFNLFFFWKLFIVSIPFLFVVATWIFDDTIQPRSQLILAYCTLVLPMDLIGRVFAHKLPPFISCFLQEAESLLLGSALAIFFTFMIHTILAPPFYQWQGIFIFSFVVLLDFYGLKILYHAIINLYRATIAHLFGNPIEVTVLKYKQHPLIKYFASPYTPGNHNFLLNIYRWQLVGFTLPNSNAPYTQSTISLSFLLDGIIYKEGDKIRIWYTPKFGGVAYFAGEKMFTEKAA